MKGSAGVNLLNNALWPPNLVGRIHDQNVMHCWGQSSCTGQPGSTTGQIPQNCPVSAKIGRKNPRPECNALMGSKVLQGSSGVNHRQNCSRNAIWLPGVIRGQPEGNCLASGVARAFPGGRAAHPEDQNEEENEEKLRKNERSYRKMRKD